jgi:5-methylcytosine-specific restriction endonuclease McrA
MKRTPLKRGSSQLKRSPMKQGLGKKASRDKSEMAGAKPAVLARSKGLCERCRSRPGTELHHRLPRRFGNNSPECLVSLCHDCHQFVTVNPAYAYETGWLIHGWLADRPDEWPDPQPV